MLYIATASSLGQYSCECFLRIFLWTYPSNNISLGSALHICCLLCTAQMCLHPLTALPVGVAQLEVSAGAGRVLLGALGAADVLDLAVEGLEGGVHLGVVLAQASGSLVGPHVPHGIGTLLGLTQAGESGHVDARAGRTRRTRGSRVTRRTLSRETETMRGCFLSHGAS